jgi:hypothetical protein
MTPSIKDYASFSRGDFEAHPLWVNVHGYDRDQPWFQTVDEQAYRPWTDELPLVVTSRALLVSAQFEFNDGSHHAGFFRPVADTWDEPLPARKKADGTFAEPLQWSKRRGGDKRSILSLHLPVVFTNERGLGFHLLREPRRKAAVEDFYKTLGKSPTDVFPVRFKAQPGLVVGVAEGEMQGFYSFPLDKPCEITTGAELLDVK